MFQESIHFSRNFSKLISFYLFDFSDKYYFTIKDIGTKIKVL